MVIDSQQGTAADSGGRRRRSRTTALVVTAASFLVALTGCSGVAPTASEPSAELALELVDGPSQPEDLVSVAGSPFLLASGLSVTPDGQPLSGFLGSIDTETGANATVWPIDDPSIDYAASAYPDCEPTPQEEISPHGLAFRASGTDGEGELYVINHEREAVEIFRVRSDESAVALTWIGCVMLPADMYGNGVAVSEDGGTLYVTKFFDPATRQSDLGALLSGMPSGEVRSWTKDGGWTSIEGTELAGPNGIAVSPNGDAVFAAEWGGQRFWKFDLTGEAEPQSVELDFWPDNVRWGDDGLLYVTGQDVTPEQVPACLSGDLGACPYTGFEIVSIDPGALAVDVVYTYDGAEFGHPTVALPVGDAYWLGTIMGDKVGKVAPSR